VTDIHPKEMTGGHPEELLLVGGKLRASAAEAASLLGARDQLTAKLLGGRKEVVSIGIGETRLPSGRRTGRLGIRVGVTDAALSSELPADVDGVPLSVDVVRPFRAQRRVRPPLCGVSIGPLGDSTAGTLGCFVTQGKDTHILTARHVLGRKVDSVTVLQPGGLDGGVALDAIATATIAAMSPDFDAALAKLTDGCTVDPRLGFRQNPKSLRAPVAGPVQEMRVEKIGRSTHHTQGKVSVIGTSVVVEYDGGDKAQLFNQFLVDGAGQIFSSDGDSGALVFSSPERQPIGLVVAGAGSRTVCSRLDIIVGHLGVSLVY
jgi:hypothetical protein